jgi:cupin 2 domain-containing protein
MTANLFAGLPHHIPEELVTTLVAAGSVRVEWIVSTGHTSPSGYWYDQPQSEWVVLLTGAARVRFDDGEVELRPGDHLTIPAHRRHRVEWTAQDGPTVWLAVHYTDAA